MGTLRIWIRFSRNVGSALSPVRFGTGIKTKNLSALAHGVPLVTTTVGADGMDAATRRNRADRRYAAGTRRCRVRAFISMKHLWCRLARQGREHILEDFSEATDAGGRALMVRARAAHGHRKTHEPEFCVAVPAGGKAVSGSGERVRACCATASAADGAVCDSGGGISGAARAGRGVGAIALHFQPCARPRAGQRLVLRAVELMSRCYSELGDVEKASRYARRIERAYLIWTFAARTAAESKNGTQSTLLRPKMPVFSVIIPTYNRQASAEGVSGGTGAANCAAGNVRSDRGG